jgi:hypothetical protein
VNSSLEGTGKTAEQMKQKNKEAKEMICSVSHSIDIYIHLICYLKSRMSGVRIPVGGMRFFSHSKRPDRL